MATDQDIPPDALVLLVGPSGAGKSTWARGHFPAGRILSSDAFRELVADDPADQGASGDAFRLLHAVARARLKRGLLTVVDATNLTRAARRPLVALARRSGRPCVAVVFVAPLHVLLARNAGRVGRVVPEDVIRTHGALLPQARVDLPDEGYAAIILIE